MRRQVGGIVDVFDTDGQTVQRHGRKTRVIGRTPCGIEIKRHERADLGLVGRDRFGAEFDDRTRGEFASFDAAGEIERGQHHRRSINATMRVVAPRTKGKAM